MPQPKDPLSITITPLKTVLPAGQLHATEHVTVRNSGSEPITIRTSGITVSQAVHGCGVGSGNGWLTVSPAHFRLRPGKSEVVTITINAPHTATGTVDTAALIAATGRAKNSDTVSGAVGSQFVVTATGTTHAPACAVAGPATGGGSSAATDAGLASLLTGVAVLGAFVAAFVKKRFRSRRDHRHQPGLIAS